MPHGGIWWLSGSLLFPSLLAETPSTGGNQEASSPQDLRPQLDRRSKGSRLLVILSVVFSPFKFSGRMAFVGSGPPEIMIVFSLDPPLGDTE